MREFKVNDYIILKLEENKTIIYVAGKRFRQCKQLILNISITEITALDEVQSIDEAIENLEKNLERMNQKIPPETEFWGHCSNIQVWVENAYDTRLLHSNLAFPLLKRLTEVGDTKALRVFKEEIVKRLGTGYAPVVEYLTEEYYLDYLTREELLYGILEPEEAESIEKLDELLGENIYLTHRFYEDLDLSFIVKEKHVIGLTLSFCKLTTFPEEITNLKLVRELRLGGNRFKTLPQSIGNLKNLDALLLFDNELVELPDSIEKLDSLQHLNLSNNKLESLPETIVNLKTLKILNLKENNIVKIPESIGNLSTLEDINFRSNNFVNIPESILKLKSLKNLNLIGISLSPTDKNNSIIKQLKARGLE